MVVVELLETIEPDEEVVDACRRLKQEGYLLALDDFVDTPDWAPLVDARGLHQSGLSPFDVARNNARWPRGYAPRGIRMLAEKVETQEEYSEAKAMGYSLFQGYFFCRPEIMQHRAIPIVQTGLPRTAAGGHRSEFDMKALASKIKHEASLTFKLLRYLNSATFGLRAEIHSIPHALILARRAGTAQMDRGRVGWGDWRTESRTS